MTEEEMAQKTKDILGDLDFKDLLGDDDFYVFIARLSQYFIEVCGLSSDVIVEENEKMFGSEILNKDFPVELYKLPFKKRNEILEEAINKRVKVMETDAYQKIKDELSDDSNE